jgi:CrcB protein
VNPVLVGIGACFGGVARYGVAKLLPSSYFPWATICINLSGSLFLGIVAAVWAKDHPTRFLLGVGFLGGFTTFSTFSLEVLEQLRSNQPGAALLNVLIQVVGGVFVCALGFYLGSRIRGGG